MTEETLQKFRDKLGEVIDVRAAISLLHWDLEVYMPPKAAPARGRQLATLSALAHRLFTSGEMGDLLKRLDEAKDALDPDTNRLIDETAYDYRRATCLPPDFVERFAEAQSQAYQAWVKAREDSDFKQFQPHLEIILDLLRQRADYLGYEETPYNALIEDYERGMTVRELDAIFGELAAKQSALVARIACAATTGPFNWLEQEWNEDAQWAFGLEVLRDMGYDFEAGRQDKSVHPFTTNFDLYDVRITTRLNPRDLFSALMGSIHEGGHALYEQGYLEADRRSTLADAPSLGIHESQSRMWENIIGRSRPFWEHYVPRLAHYFPGQLDGVTAGQIFQAINRVRPSLIRVEADECTYNLHIILRFELEKALIEGDLTAAEVPAAWNEKMKAYLGVDVPDDAHGCLQDIHWSHGSFGYFPTYALGNLYASQIFEAVNRDLPGIWDSVGAGDFAPLLSWLRKHVHQIGRRKSATEIVRDATGKAPGPEAFLHYLESKYGELYAL